MMKQRNIINQNNEALKQNLIDFSKNDMDTIYKIFNTDINGITEEEAGNRVEKYGLNQVEHEKPTPWYIQFVKGFINPFIIVLIALAVISYITDVALAAPGEKSWEAVIVITAMVTISGILHFVQEYRSGKAAEELKALVNTTATIVRKDTGTYEIPMSQIVPGDIIHLAAGDMIPADLRIIHSKDLFISQSALTGESEPIEKYSTIKSEINNNINPSDLDNICLLGTDVISGSATAIVIGTGNDTYFGSMAKSLVGKREQTSFEKGVSSVSWLLIRFMFIMVPVVFLINGITNGDWLEALLFAISIAVGLTPEMLPVIVTTNLAKGAIAMSKRKTVVKRLDAIQNFGAMDILCTDKTGTLTLDKIVVEKHLDIHGNEDDRVLRHGYLNSFYQTGLRNLMDRAILEFSDKKNFFELKEHYTKVDEIPFDFTRRRMSVVLKDHVGKRQLITKGAVEEMLSICTFAEYKGEVVPLTEEVKNEVMDMVKKLNEDGMRVVAIAQKNNIPDENSFGVKDESDMVLMGYIGFLDPPKESTAAAIKALYEHGVKVKILTGDNEVVTKKICKEVDLPVDNILLGSDIEHLTDEELAIQAENTTVFAKLSPIQKSKIIKVLQGQGHTVGYMGDGINDASALRDADVGISVDTAVDIAKESADIILLEKDLMVLEEGVIEGRKIFGNIVKYLNMTASSNFGNVFSVLVASAFLPFLPMLPIHLLIQNLFYDFSQISIPWDTMDEDYIKEPRKWDADNIKKFMIYIGPISSIFDIITYLVMWYVFKANTPALQSLFQSGWFVEGLLSQTLIVHMIRTKKIPFIQSRATAPVLLLTGIIMVAGIFIPFTAFGASVGLQPLPLAYFPWLIGILLAYCLLTQVVKKLYIKKFNTWL
ncbi:magnesium-translocating P-type ATPase [Alkaliphilus sp. B6464]|uniref:magnesium-translocating P-type ATPase n=1 Tax=Alkaliphilus sp. B6464 TaxID=2731219 RepID=UPI001BA97CAC|nr:magnesium-translocating P-type ATPase [Alkaliphilus sp. B6464]QUH18944.1 magnesium-translocating P-type ATPase [Alkaliphilus sp. B6464]